jgi:hypothetical protein
MVTVQSVVMIVVHQVIVQQVAPMAIAIHVQVLVRLPIAANVVTVRATRAQVQTVANVVHQVIVQPVVHTGIVIHVQVLVRLPIAESAVTVQEIHDQVLIVQQVAHMVTATHVRRHDHHQIVHVETTHLVAIVQRQAMIDVPQVALTVHATIDHHATIAVAHVTANAAVDQIVPEVVFPMIAKSVHAVALAKSA